MLDNHVSHHPQAALPAVWVQMWQGGGLRCVRGNEGLKALDTDKTSPTNSVTFHLSTADPFVNQGTARADILGCASWPEIARSRKSGRFVRLRQSAFFVF